MPRVAPLMSNFGSGEFSPLMFGRVDSDLYRTGLAVCLNYMPMIQGGLVRRSGNRYVAEVKTSTEAVRLLPFEFSTEQAYIIETGDQYFRFYKDNGQILSGGSPFQISSPYLEAELFELNFTQSADVLYLAHISHAPRKLTRTSDTAWTLTVIDFLDGPYGDANSSVTNTFTPSGTTGTVTITSIDATFVATDVDRLISFVQLDGLRTWMKILVFTDTTHVDVEILGQDLTSVSATLVWKLGLWSSTTGYPSVVGFHENRLVFANAPAEIQRFDMSNSADFENYAPSVDVGTVSVITASNSISFSLSSNKVNAVRWISSEEKGMLVGTQGGEWVVRPSSLGDAMSPINVSAKQVTYYGSSTLRPLQVGKSTLFVQRAGRKLRDLTYFFDVDGFRAPDLAVLSEHLTFGGFVDIDYQQEPQSMIWAPRADGTLIGITYERQLENLKVGWHRHIIGGQSDAAGTQAQVETVAVIPSADGTRDELWMIVKRHINGVTKRYVEYTEKIFDDETDQQDSFFVDSGLTLDNPQFITGATKANPAVITSVAHGRTDGDKIIINEVKGMTQLNTNTYLVANKTANTFELTDLTGNNIDSTNFSTYVSGGEIRVLVLNISGLSHLEGETVSILGDGAVQPDKVVSSGSITLSTPAAVVHVGYQFISRGQLLRLEAGSADGTSLGKTRRINRVNFLLHRSLGFKFGRDFDNLDTKTFRVTSDPPDRAVPLFTGILSETLDMNYDFENQIAWEQDQPLPSMILGVAPQMVTQDRG